MSTRDETVTATVKAISQRLCANSVPAEGITGTGHRRTHTPSRLTLASRYYCYNTRYHWQALTHIYIQIHRRNRGQQDSKEAPFSYHSRHHRTRRVCVRRRAPPLPSCHAAGRVRYLSPWEQKWISGLFRTVTHGGRSHPELRAGLTEIWCRPPPLPLVVNVATSGPNRYFGDPLFPWLPRRLWSVLLSCPECGTLLASPCTTASGRPLTRGWATGWPQSA